MSETIVVRPVRRNRWANLLMVALVIPVMTTGCIDTSGLGEIAKAVDGFTDRLRKESSNWSDQSELWRKEFADLSAYLRSKGQDRLADDVERSGKSLISAADNSLLKGNIDYLLDILKAYLRELAAELRAERRRYHNGEVNRDEVYTSVMERLARKKIFLNPVVQNLNPDQVNLTHDTATNAVRGPSKALEITGYGFQRPADEPDRFSVEVIGVRGVRRLDRDLLSTTTDKMMKLKLDGVGTFEPGDKKLVLYTNTERTEKYELGLTITPLKIDTIKKTEDTYPPVPIHRVVFDIKTLRDDKNKTAQVNLILILDNNELHSSKEIGREEEFEENKPVGTFTVPEPSFNDLIQSMMNMNNVKDIPPRHGPIVIKKDGKLIARVVHEQFRPGDLFIPIAKWEASITVEFQQWDGKAYKTLVRQSQNRYFDAKDAPTNTLDFTVLYTDLKK